MSKEKGIFEPQEGFASPPPAKSPFAIDETPSNPFASDLGGKSPFAVTGEENPPKQVPESKQSSEPFESSAEKSPFSYDSPAAGFGGSPFEGSAPRKEQDSPFGPKPEPKTEEPAKQSDAPFGTPTPVQSAPPLTPVEGKFSDDSYDSDSGSIRQLELRAIFGVDRELTSNEILQRAGSLPGIRQLARVNQSDAGAVEAIKRVVGGLGFGSGPVKLYCGNAPIDFIREGSVLLAVQTDGSFAPGVRETLIISARELGRM